MKLEKHEIELIENLTVDTRQGLHLSEVWYVLLAKLGLKSASIFEFKWKTDESDKPYVEKMIVELADVCEKLSIPYFYKTRKNPRFVGRRFSEDGMAITVDFMIASSMDNLEKIKKLAEVFDLDSKEWSADSNWHRELGQILGFPKTAVENFIELLAQNIPPALNFHEAIESGEVDLSGLEEAYSAANFALSLKNYREELAVVETWLEVLRENSGNIYRDLIESEKAKIENIKFV